MRIIRFVRHGQSLSNVGGATMDHHASPLTDKGRQQARALAELLPAQPRQVLVSPFERALDTAAPYCQLRTMEPQPLQLLHEFTTYDPVQFDGMTGKQRQPLIDEYWKRAEPHFRMGQSAETFSEFAARVDRFHDEVLPTLEDGTVIFGHGMWMALLCWRLLGFSRGDDYAMRNFRRFQLGLPMPNGAVYELHETTPGHWRLQADEVVMRTMLAIAEAGAQDAY